jgi:hypothetical protein
VKIPRRSSSNSEGSGGGAGNKRKHFAWESHGSSLDLQLGDPLPLDWEQCLDLHVRRQTDTYLCCFLVSIIICIRFLLLFSL